MVKRIDLLSVLLLGTSAFTQPVIDWQQIYGGSEFDRAYCIDRTSDGGYIVTGESSSSDGDVIGIHEGPATQDAWVIRLDAEGSLLWQNALGGSGWEVGVDVKQTLDGGFIMTGSTNSSDGDVTEMFGGSDIWVVKLDATGGILWEHSFGGSGSESPWALEELDNGDIVITGETTSNNGHMTGCDGSTEFWLARLSATGELLWSNCLGGGHVDSVRDLTVFPDGSVGLVGWTRSTDGDVTGIHGSGDPPQPDTWVVKSYANGELEWQTCLGGSANDAGWAIEVAPNGKVYVASTALSTDGDVSTQLGGGDYWVARLADDGTLEMEHSFGGTSGDAPWGMFCTSASEILVVGSSVSTDGDVSSSHGSTEAWVIKLDENLELLWERSFGGSLSDSGRDIHWSEDGVIALTGSSNSTDGDLTTNYGDNDFWVVKLRPEPVGLRETVSYSFTLSPNPATSELRIGFNGIAVKRLEVIDITGRVVMNKSITRGAPSVDLSIAQLAQGTYSLRVLGDASYTQRFVKY
ncbi:MAG: T9SS type A sorting domain-containing protein [Flavobacteriales bacterium]|nr:T9SS type A sorting domain-containing protein [Flavobacteriales bacterium]